VDGDKRPNLTHRLVGGARSATGGGQLRKGNYLGGARTGIFNQCGKGRGAVCVGPIFICLDDKEDDRFVRLKLGIWYRNLQGKHLEKRCLFRKVRRGGRKKNETPIFGGDEGRQRRNGWEDPFVGGGLGLWCAQGEEENRKDREVVRKRKP